MKIAILGRGTAGVLSAAAYVYYGYDVECYYDSNIPTQEVGEGSTLVLPHLLTKWIGYSHSDIYEVGGTPKLGILKENWSGNGSFYHDFGPATSTALHFNARKLQEYIIKKLKNKVRFIEKNVTSHNDIDADFVIDCRGTPKDNDDNLIECDYIPVNSAYVNQCYWDGPKYFHTLTIARPYGWVFGVPLQNRMSIGYLYNSEINDKNQILEDVENIYNTYGLKPSMDKININFKSYVRKRNFDGRVIYNGNASFFLEPIEATSTQFMIDVIFLGLSYIRGESTEDEVNSKYDRYVQAHSTVIMQHYLPGSKFKNEFWKTASNHAKELMSSTVFTKDFYESYRTETPGFFVWQQHNWQCHLDNTDLKQELKNLGVDL